MKLASALSQRADLQKRLAQMQDRLNNNAKVQEGDTPAEDPTALLVEMNDDFVQLEKLMTLINRTNSSTVVKGKTLTAWIAERDCLRQKIGMMRSFLNAASAKTDRYSQKEIRVTSTVPVADLQKQLDDLCGRLRLVSDTIEEANWTVDLLEE